MSLRDELRAVLPEGIVVKKIDRDSDIHGRPAVEVQVGNPKDLKYIICQFARNNNLSDSQIAELVAKKWKQIYENR